MLNEDGLRDGVLQVFANKQDLPNPINAAEITDKLGLHSLRQRHWYIQSTCAISGGGNYKGLDRLSNNITNKVISRKQFSAGATVEVRTKVESFGIIWAPAITIKENEDGTLLVKYKSLSGGEDEWTKTSVPYSEVRPSPPPFDLRAFSLMENVDALLECGWCPSVLRPSMEWKDGAWQTQEEKSSCYFCRDLGSKMVNDVMNEESNNRKSVSKRKREQQPRKFISTPDSLPNSVVETPHVKETTMVLPFVKKSPCWKVFESMEIFKAVPQRPHFSPLLECEEEFREGEAIGAMVNFTGLLEKVRDIQVHDSVSAINRIRDCFLKLEKHGFDVTAPRSRIHKILCIKECQTWALKEVQYAERMITEKGSKRRKLQDDIELVSKKIVELRRQEALLKEEKVTNEKEIARMKSHAVVLDRKVQSVEQDFMATVSPPWY
uniref:Agenet domain-containing protein n=1 Tax=Brassica campestris TaxID=3711 RepID=A0A3P6BU83_BRACM|nr:unnamed protein product [Brassica rapa]